MSAGHQLFARGSPVRAGEEFHRIRRLPRRSWDASLTGRLTDLLKTPEGSQKLRDIQAQSLYEIGEIGGLLGPIRVGAGKTLISLLAPRVLEAKRPLLLLPAALIEKTKREQRSLSKDWRVSRHLRMYSYEQLGRVGSQFFLEQYKPDLIIADECHKLKNFRAGVTRRVDRYMRAHPETKCVMMSGTIMSKSLNDFAHLSDWALKENSPLPRERETVEEWAKALDEDVPDYKRKPIGALAQFGGASLEEARQGFNRRLVETPGVVASQNAQEYSGSLSLNAIEYPVNQATEEAFKRLRERWETPDGWALSEAVAVWRHARELAIGLHYLWDPRAPAEWLNARRGWAQWVREILSRSRTLDTELQVANAVGAGQLNDHGLLNQWREIKPAFKVNPKPAWHDDTALKICANWLEINRGICWVEHVFFSERLAQMTGHPYFGQEGLDEKGRPIESASGPVIASIASCGTGRNLQHWNRNLLTTIPDPTRLEQLIARTHRPGQKADEVSVDFLLGCAEHYDALVRARSMSETQQSLLGQEQKLLLADLNYPESIDSRDGFRWKKSKKG